MPEALLAVRDLEAFYGDFQALFGVSIEVAQREAVAVIGANGAGKSTLLKSIAGLLRARRDAINFSGAPIGGMPAYAVAARGATRRGASRSLHPTAPGRGESLRRRQGSGARRPDQRSG